jgi:hypothetical protein
MTAHPKLITVEEHFTSPAGLAFPKFDKSI